MYNSKMCIFLDLVGLTALVYKKNEIKYLIYDIAEVWLLNIDGDKRKEEIKKNWLWRMAAFTRGIYLANC